MQSDGATLATPVFETKLVRVGPLGCEACRNGRKNDTPRGDGGRSVESPPKERVDRRFVRAASASRRRVSDDESSGVAGEVNGIPARKCRLPKPLSAWLTHLTAKNFMRYMASAVTSEIT